MKECKNPWVFEKTKNSFDRECSLSDIPYTQREDGTRGCIWCGDVLRNKHVHTRYCADKECARSAYIWGYPQKHEACLLFLQKQDFKCKICQLDFSQYIDKNISSENFLKEKRSIPQEHKPEVDHIIPIIQGGQSLGIDNHQVLCYTCHKEKTKKDVKGPKRIKSEEELSIIRDKKILDKIYTKLEPFLREYYKGTIEENFKNYRDIFLMEILSIEELECMQRDFKRTPPFESSNGFNQELWVEEALQKRKKN